MRKVIAAVAALAFAGLPLIWSAPTQAAVPTCFGKPATIVGTDGPDYLTGQSGVADVIYGGGGNDTISGGDFYQQDQIPGAAPDLLCGGPGDDTMRDSPGSDKLNGGDGNDTMRDYGYGNDLLQGNAGDDWLNDESCADCGYGNDVLHGNGGNDTIANGWGKDKDYGDAGADRLYDYECDGPTYLNGGAGNDYLESYSSSFDGYGTACNRVADTVVGGTETDTAKVDRLDSVTGVEHVTRIVQ
jgi:Ca2+-binding RTX toxin-like protein